MKRILRVTLGIALAFGCARQVNTLEPLEEDDHEPSGGTAGKGGGSPLVSAGSSSAGKPGTGGTAVIAFGGSATSGGAAGSANGLGGGGTRGGAAGAGGASSQGGTTQAGSNQGGSGGGSAGRGGGSSGSGGSTSSGGAVGSGCLVGWRDNEACDTCTPQTQGDKKACAQVLDCYLQNDCGPATCAGNDDECGANTIQQGTAPYPIAQDVYDCICN